VESDQVNVLPFAVLRDLEQVEDSEKSRLASKVRSDVGKSYRFDRVYFDLALFHPVTCAHSYMGPHPDAHAAGDLSATNTFTQPSGKHHRSECTPA
jgi:hypothetical protein